jgi:hypothetical protein
VRKGGWERERKREREREGGRERESTRGPRADGKEYLKTFLGEKQNIFASFKSNSIKHILA